MRKYKIGKYEPAGGDGENNKVISVGQGVHGPDQEKERADEIANGFNGCQINNEPADKKNDKTDLSRDWIRFSFAQYSLNDQRHTECDQKTDPKVRYCGRADIFALGKIERLREAHSRKPQNDKRQQQISYIALFAVVDWGRCHVKGL